MPWSAFDSAALSAFSAFGAAWLGALLGFRKTRRERALDRVVTWHEEAVQSLALYEEQLERLRKQALTTLVVLPHLAGASDAAPDATPEVPKLFRPTPEAWSALGEAEARARAALRLADSYTDGRVAIECSVALTTTVDIVAGQWLDPSPVPQIPWLDLSSRAFAAGRVCRQLQTSLRLVLELDGAVAALLGPRYRRWRLLRQLRRLGLDSQPPNEALKLSGTPGGSAPPPSPPQGKAVSLGQPAA